MERRRVCRRCSGSRSGAERVDGARAAGGDLGDVCEGGVGHKFYVAPDERSETGARIATKWSGTAHGE